MTVGEIVTRGIALQVTLSNHRYAAVVMSTDGVAAVERAERHLNLCLTIAVVEMRWRLQQPWSERSMQTVTAAVERTRHPLGIWRD